MSFDYTEMLATAQELIEEFGRSITVRRLTNTPADANKPWRGAANPASPISAQVTLAAVGVPPYSLIELGKKTLTPELSQRSTLIFIAAPDDAATDITGFDEVVDADGKVYRITELHTLRPASTTLLHYIGVG